MKRVFARLATTHLDKQGETMALSALESMTAHIAKTYVPIGIEHDPRTPPIGRIVSASVVQLTENEFAVEGELEVFESEEEVPLGDEAREVPSHSSPPDAVLVSSDYRFGTQRTKLTSAGWPTSTGRLLVMRSRSQQILLQS